MPRHLSEWTSPREAGCKPFDVWISLDASRPLSVEGVPFRHPAAQFRAVVWATSTDNVHDVLRYHWPDRLQAYTVHGPAEV